MRIMFTVLDHKKLFLQCFLSSKIVILICALEPLIVRGKKGKIKKETLKSAVVTAIAKPPKLTNR